MTVAEGLKLESETLKDLEKDLDHQNVVQYLGFKDILHLSMSVLISVEHRHTANRSFLTSLDMFRVVQLPVSWGSGVGSTRT